jgi:hypothetical protein
MAKIILSIAKTTSHRGLLAQQGAIPLLLQIYGTKGIDDSLKTIAAHALARTLISINPSLIPGYTNACIRPLLSLLDQKTSFASNDQPRNLLPTFESLLALTNLTSNARLPTGPTVVTSAYDAIEDLLLSSNELVQRAATELVCNLANVTAEGLAKLADGTTEAARRINVLLALADAEDIATRQAAIGALVGALEYPGAVTAVLQRSGGVKRLLSLCQDEDEGCVVRGVVGVRSFVSCENSEGVAARKAVDEQGGKEVLGEVIKKCSKNEEVVFNALEALHLMGGLQ